MTIQEDVSAIIESVRKDGDEAVRQFTLKFDKAAVRGFELTPEEISLAMGSCDKRALAAIRTAARNIRGFAEKQKEQLTAFRYSPSKGILLGQSIVPLARVGCYVPAGRFPLPSTALMGIIPAKVAGVKEILVCSPPTYSGTVNPYVVAAAKIAGADRIFKAGGVQAIAAMALGTESMPSVDKIVGPGNKYVVEAKRQLYGTVGIDILAGPSELLVIADDSSDAELIALDLMAESEHDADTRVWLLTDSRKLIVAVGEQLDKMCAASNAVLKLFPSLEAAALESDKIAPEHLELLVRNPEKLMAKLKCFGSLFIGESSPAVFGDYCSGTNHILPTGGAARFSGGLGVKDFQNVRTWQRISASAAQRLAATAGELASAEGLQWHMKAAMARNSKVYKTKSRW